MSSPEDPPRTDDNNTAEAANTDRPPARRHGGSISSFILIIFALFMLTNNRGDEAVVRNRYVEALESSTYQLSNYSAWMNGTASNFSLVRLSSPI